jgi:hypothetical protein
VAEDGAQGGSMKAGERSIVVVMEEAKWRRESSTRSCTRR